MDQPRLLLERLHTLAQHERRLRLAWGFARWMIVILGALLLAGAIDWWIDLWYDTPTALRWLMRIAIVGLAGWCFYRWLIVAPRQGLSPTELAHWVEAHDPRHGHRLISAVELNQPDANREGMSASLIQAVTAEAEQIASDQTFTELLDRRRWTWSLFLLVPLVLIPFLCWLLAPATSTALLQRQLGMDAAIPRTVTLTGPSDQLLPSGEPVVLRFVATGISTPDLVGTVEITPDGQSSERYPLRYESEQYQQATFTATVPASSTPFVYRAWLGDGRTHHLGQVAFAPRPILSAWEAWLLLPAYTGLRPNGQRYELAQPKGDLKPVPGCQARISVTTPMPITEAMAELLAPLVPDLGSRLIMPVGPLHPAYLLDAQRLIGWTPTGAGPLFLTQQVPLTIQPDGLGAAATVTLPPAASAYRIIVKDHHGMTNRPIPRRVITFHSDELPQVTLLPERFNQPGITTDDLDLEGMPIPLDRSVRIGYVVRDDLALESVTLRYRLNDGPWEQLPLTELTATPAGGSFDVKSGAFTTSGSKDQVAWYALPPGDPDKQLGRSLGGGRFDFQTRAIPGLKIGDALEYYLEARDKHNDPTRLPGRSVTRRKLIVTEAQFVEWLVHTVQQEARLRQVEKQQKKVFEPK